MNKTKIKVVVVSDVVCPWCYIGKRRLDKAIHSLGDQFDIHISFQPFELNPQMPTAGRNQKEYLTAKFGSPERYRQLSEHVTKVAGDEGLQFDFGKQEISPNTFDAHRVIWLAGEPGVQSAVKEALMSAYFEQGIDLSKRSNLVKVAVAAGLQEKAVNAMLDSEQGIAEVRNMEEVNSQRGITGVPFYIINDKYGVSGAQASETFRKALIEIGQETAPEGESCDVDQKNC
jgi:predicted DsbA family dithiol-disulfide isomerase